MASKDTTSLSTVFARFSNNAALSDVTIIFGGRQFHGHRMVLAAKSDYFSAMFTGAFKEKNQTPITLEDDHEEALFIMLSSFYDDHAIQKLNNWTNDTELIKALFSVADKYQAPSVKSLALSKMLGAFTGGWDADTATSVMEALTELSPSVLRPYYAEVNKAIADTNFLSVFSYTQFDDMLEAHSELAVYVVKRVWYKKLNLAALMECSDCKFVKSQQTHKFNWSTFECPICDEVGSFQEI
ncbi:hypothetical protein B9Z65_5628 [Elsinoe australis]|uniref:BTB domain-containing protein n=1 Tax=Elsinoe australis TaxID=40998 RepID=A0A2P7Z3A5_9PEZI|nr:hypothetical protein B9Z65_5628 [Elsinoe australis]